jgi:hypothetical protein
MRTRVFLAVVALMLGLISSCKSGNQPPVVTSFSVPDTVYPGTDHACVCAVTDSEGDPMTLTWTCTGGTLTPDTGTSVSWRAPDSACKPRVTVKARDSHGGEGSDFKDVVVTTAANRPPVITGISGPDSLEAGGNSVLACTANDPDGDTLVYAWTCNTGGLSGNSGQNVTWYAPDTAASAVVTVVVTDGALADTAGRNIQVKPTANRPPVIDSLVGPASLPAKTDAQYTCFASDLDNDSIAYSWSCQRGHLSSTSGQSVTWTAPETSGSVIVTCTARDGHGGEDVRPKTVSVTKVITTWLDTMISIPARGSQAYYGTMRQDYTVSGSFSVDDGYDINFYVLDSANYFKWANSQTFSALVSKERSTGTSYSAVIPSTRRYYVLMDNTYSLFTNKIVTVLTKLTTP